MSAKSLAAVMAAGLAPRVKAQALSGVPGGGGWYGVIREAWGGAWQRNIVIDGPRDVLAFSAVFACVTVIASDIAKLRIKLVEEDDDGIWNEVEPGSPFLPVLRKPNRYQTRIKFLEQWIVSKLLHGNAYALKVRDNRGGENRGVVTGLYMLDPQRVTPLVAETGDVYYQLNSDHLSGLRVNVTVPASEIIHDMMVSLWHPLVGVSPIYACGISATQGRRIQANSTKFFDNMSRPSGMLTAAEKISDELAKRLQTEWDNNFGGGNLGRTAVLGEGLKYEAMTIPAQEAQLIEQLKWTVEDVARCFHVPLYKIGGPVPVGNTIEQLNQGYYSDCLQALIEAFELCMDEGLKLPPKMYTELDLDGLLRMDMASLVKTEVEAIKGSAKTPNEARKKLNLKPLPGGNTIYMQQQEFSLEALSKRDAREDPFATAAKTEPNVAPTTEPANDSEAEERAATARAKAIRADEDLQAISAIRLRAEAEERAREIAITVEKARDDSAKEAARLKREEDGRAEQEQTEMLADLFAKGFEPAHVGA